MAIPILSPLDVLQRGLGYLAIGQEEQERMRPNDKIAEFKSHYGSSPLVIAAIWFDLCHTTIEAAQLNEKEKSERGFKRFMIAHYQLWTYPKNATMMKRRFNICLRYLQGSELWHWPKKIAALKEKVIVWPQEFDSDETAIIALSVDGLNFRAWEKKHPTLNKDPKFYDHKHNSCGFKYELGIQVYEPKIVWIKGPIRAGKGDRELFNEDGLRDKLASTAGKLGVADGGYEGPGRIGFLCLPNAQNSRGLRRLKSRARCRHEAVNGRLETFAILQHTFRHGMDCHKVAFEAVAVIVQYQMDNGAPIFDV